MKTIGKVRYIGRNIDLNSLEDGKIYRVVGFQEKLVRVIDGTGYAYLFSKSNPASLLHPENNGRWEIVEDPLGELTKNMQLAK